MIFPICKIVVLKFALFFVGKLLLLALLRALAKRSTNTLDDSLIDAVEKALTKEEVE